jgi:hypothetical protein
MPLLTRPDEYTEEAVFFRKMLEEAVSPPPHTLLELGSGGGNNAFHLKAHFKMTLTDLSPTMLAVSRALNPKCEHVEGDMRSLRLGRTFDAVFVHDAIEYMTCEADLKAAMQTAFAHCKPGGVALFAPDNTRENFSPATEYGGYDGEDGRCLRYLEWDHDPDPSDDVCVADFVYMLRERDGAVRTVYDRHHFGLFTKETWLRLLREVGFQPRAMPDPWRTWIFVAVRPGCAA